MLRPKTKLVMMISGASNQNTYVSRPIIITAVRAQRPTPIIMLRRKAPMSLERRLITIYEARSSN
jgi:hypothetical protein